MSTRAVFDPDYLSLDENFPFAVNIEAQNIEKEDKTIKTKVFPNKESAFIFLNEFNNHEAL